jgi:hypothetical protein
MAQTTLYPSELFSHRNPTYSENTIALPSDRGALEISDTNLMYEGTRVKTWIIGRDVNPGGRGDGGYYAQGGFSAGSLRPMPTVSPIFGFGNSVNNYEDDGGVPDAKWEWGEKGMGKPCFAHGQCGCGTSCQGGFCCEPNYYGGHDYGAGCWGPISENLPSIEKVECEVNEQLPNYGWIGDPASAYRVFANLYAFIRVFNLIRYYGVVSNDGRWPMPPIQWPEGDPDNVFPEYGDSFKQGRQRALAQLEDSNCVKDPRLKSCIRTVLEHVTVRCALGPYGGGENWYCKITVPYPHVGPFLATSVCSGAPGHPNDPVIYFCCPMLEQAAKQVSMPVSDFIAGLLIHEATHICLGCLAQLTGEVFPSNPELVLALDAFHQRLIDLMGKKADACTFECFPSIKPIHTAGEIKTSCSCNTDEEPVEMIERR